MSINYKTRVTRLSIAPEGEPIFSEQCTNVSIDDESGGEFIVIEQQSGRPDPGQKIRIDSDEWTHIKAAVETLLKDCRIEP